MKMFVNFLFFFVFFGVFTSFFSCAGHSIDVLFQVEGVALKSDETPSPDGTFIVRDFRIEPTNVQVVLGDVHLLTEEPPQDTKIYSSLPPLLAPGELIDPEDIGKKGRFPGLWAVDITPGQQPLSFAPGKMLSGQQKEIQLRFAPAVQGVLGIKSESIRGYTLLFDANAQKDQKRCILNIRLSFEAGLGQRISFTVEDGKKYKNTILINYANWLKDLDLDNLCTQAQVKIDSSSHQHSATLIREAFLHSFKFIFAETN